MRVRVRGVRGDGDGGFIVCVWWWGGEVSERDGVSGEMFQGLVSLMREFLHCGMMKKTRNFKVRIRCDIIRLLPR